jgi:hypothetical protein
LKYRSSQDAAGSSLKLDTRPIQAKAPKYDVGKETQKLDSKVALCKAGVAWIDLLDIGERIQFGVYNDRPENDSETTKLVASFKASGIVSMKETSAIPLIIDLSRVKNATSLAANFNLPDEVPELEVKDIQKIIGASGQHRRAALQRYHTSLQDEYQSLEKKRLKINTLKNLSEDHVRDYNKMRSEMCTIKGLMDGLGKWGVVIYDQGEQPCTATATVSTALFEALYATHGTGIA